MKASMSWVWASVLGVALVAAGGKASATAGGHQLKSRELQTERAGIAINLYEKWAPSEEANFKKTGKIILLVHGATWSSRCTFDPAPGFSLMDTLADAGYDVWAVDLHGYGKSGKTERDWTESAAAAEDIDAAVDYIRALRWVEKVHLFGYQWGAQPVGVYATQKPNKVGRVVLFGMRYSLFEKRQEPAAQYRFNNLQTASLRPDDGDLDPDFARHRATVCAGWDAQSPNGALRDMARQSTVDPSLLKSPTLLVMGDHDGDASVMQDRLDFYRSVAAHNKWFVVLPGLGKYASIERGHARFDNALLAFLGQ